MNDAVGEAVVRTIHAAGMILAGETGGRIANKITGKAGLGRIEKCRDPKCDLCSPRH